MTVGNGNADPGRKAMMMATMQPVAVIGLLSAIAIPNFVRRRETAQQNAIFNNLRMIDAAKEAVGAGEQEESWRDPHRNRTFAVSPRRRRPAGFW